jgi:hypothetical protein
MYQRTPPGEGIRKLAETEEQERARSPELHDQWARI